MLESYLEGKREDVERRVVHVRFLYIQCFLLNLCPLLSLFRHLFDEKTWDFRETARDWRKKREVSIKKQSKDRCHLQKNVLTSTCVSTIYLPLISRSLTYRWHLLLFTVVMFIGLISLVKVKIVGHWRVYQSICKLFFPHCLHDSVDSTRMNSFIYLRMLCLEFVLLLQADNGQPVDWVAIKLRFNSRKPCGNQPDLSFIPRVFRFDRNSKKYFAALRWATNFYQAIYQCFVITCYLLTQQKSAGILAQYVTGIQSVKIGLDRHRTH